MVELYQILCGLLEIVSPLLTKQNHFDSSFDSSRAHMTRMDMTRMDALSCCRRMVFFGTVSQEFYSSILTKLHVTLGSSSLLAIY